MVAIKRELNEDVQVTIECSQCFFEFDLHSNVLVIDTQVCPRCHNEEMRIIDFYGWNRDQGVSDIPYGSYYSRHGSLKGYWRYSNGNPT